VPYLHVVFTLSATIAASPVRTRPRSTHRRTAAAETMIAVAADPKHLGARIGITAVLHT
jgi:hypothetical protein